MMDKREYCPTCGRSWRMAATTKTKRAVLAEVLAGSGWQRKERQVYAAGAGLAKALPAGSIWERREPARVAELAGDVIVPFCQATVTALVGAAVGGIFKGVGGATVAGGVLFGVTWVGLLWDHRQGLWLVERIVGKDLDGDGSTGKPNTAADPPIILRAPERFRTPESKLEPGDVGTRDVSNPNRRLALDLKEFLILGERDGFALRGWTGRELSSGTRVTDSTWREWTGILSGAGILQVDNAGTRLADGLTLDDALKCIILEWE